LLFIFGGRNVHFGRGIEPPAVPETDALRDLLAGLTSD
jgi:hypothetical protein